MYNATVRKLLPKYSKCVICGGRVNTKNGRITRTCSKECKSELISNNIKSRHERGLMKEPAKRGNATKRQRYSSGEIINWTEGKTKYTDRRIMEASIKIRAKQIEAMKSGKYSLNPNKKEQFIIDLINKYKKDYKFVGDGKFWIEDMNPDFININGKKHVIEVYGCYWHGCPKCFPGHKVAERKEAEARINKLAKYGYIGTIIWEHEITKTPELVENQIRNL